MSVGFLLKEVETLLARSKGERQVRQFLGDVRWGELDYPRHRYAPWQVYL